MGAKNFFEPRVLWGKHRERKTQRTQPRGVTYETPPNACVGHVPPPPWAVNSACPGCDWSQHIVIKVAYEEAPENPFLDCFGKASAIQRTHSSAGQSDTMKSLIRFACLELPLVRPLQPLLPELGDDGREA